MKNWMLRTLLILPLLGGSLLVGMGCEPKGPAQQAGEDIDNAVDNTVDALDPRGPAEKAGDAIDDALDN